MNTARLNFPPPTALTPKNFESCVQAMKKRVSYQPADEDYFAVSKILQAVKASGDEALLKYSAQFDKYAPTEVTDLLVSDSELREAENLVDDSLKETMKLAKSNIETFHKNQVPSDWSITPNEGIKLGQRICPMGRVALYIPGGKAAYPSTVLMNAIPAILAGVKSIAIFTPPNAEGRINPLVLYAASLLGIREIYKLGGAQAIAAAAYGTAFIKPVDKIVGPGNRFVALAKKMVFGTVAIDMIAGPSEVMVIADDSAKPDWIAADLLAQAEHDEDAALYLLTTNFSLPSSVFEALEAQLMSLPKANIAKAALSNNFHVFVCESLDLCLELSNTIAPEHLELMIENPEASLPKVTAAGSVFLGAFTPEALGDYFAGTNHTLPTSGTARFSSPLGVYDFITRPSYLYYDQTALNSIGGRVVNFAKAEDLEAHSRSVSIRLEVPYND